MVTDQGEEIASTTARKDGACPHGCRSPRWSWEVNPSCPLHGSAATAEVESRSPEFAALVRILHEMGSTASLVPAGTLLEALAIVEAATTARRALHDRTMENTMADVMALMDIRSALNEGDGSDTSLRELEPQEIVAAVRRLTSDERTGRTTYVLREMAMCGQEAFMDGYKHRRGRSLWGAWVTSKTRSELKIRVGEEILVAATEHRGPK